MTTTTTTRVLPPSEWTRPEVAPLLALHPFVRDGEMQIVVVEDPAGEIIARWAVLRVVHLEGVWIADAHRHKPGIARSLLRATIHLARQWTDTVAMTGAADAATRRLVTKHLNGVPIACEHFWVPVAGDQSCRYSH